MFKKSIISVIALTLSLTSCQKLLNTDIDYEQQMVVAGILVPGKLVEVKLTPSTPIRDKVKVKPIGNATVSLFEGGNLLGYLEFTADSTYTLDVPIAQGKTYTLRAACNGYPPIEATTTVPTAQNFTVVRMVHADDGPADDYETYVSITFPASLTTSYYGIYSFYTKEIFTGVETYTSYEGIPLYVNQYVEFIDQSMYWLSYRNIPEDFTNVRASLNLRTYSPSDREVWECKYIFLSNAPFAGGEFTIRKDGYGYSEDFVDFRIIYLMSPELYKSFKGFAAQNSTSNSLVVTPAPAFNCIEGGLGYFGSLVVHTYSPAENTIFY